MNFNGQVEQDRWVLHMLKNKQNGIFVEIGSNDPIHINNTYILEKQFGWKGVMIEYDSRWLNSYKNHRPNSIHIINDATQIDYKDLFEKLNMPPTIDYLQIDLDIDDGNSTLKTLNRLDREIFDHYKFATITFEHDVYHEKATPTTRELSREIFNQRGYFRVLDDISNENNPYEDWYVHPDLVDMSLVSQFKQNNLQNYTEHSITGITIEAKNIVY